MNLLLVSAQNRFTPRYRTMDNLWKSGKDVFFLKILILHVCLCSLHCIETDSEKEAIDLI